MYAEQAKWVESLSESLAFVPLAVETTTWVSHQTGIFLHLSTLPLLVELDMMKISTSLLGNKKRKVDYEEMMWEDGLTERTLSTDKPIIAKRLHLA